MEKATFFDINAYSNIIPISITSNAKSSSHDNFASIQPTVVRFSVLLKSRQHRLSLLFSNLRVGQYFVVHGSSISFAPHKVYMNAMENADECVPSLDFVVQPNS